MKTEKAMRKGEHYDSYFTRHTNVIFERVRRTQQQGELLVVENFITALLLG